MGPIRVKTFAQKVYGFVWIEVVKIIDVLLIVGADFVRVVDIRD